MQTLKEKIEKSIKDTNLYYTDYFHDQETSDFNFTEKLKKEIQNITSSKVYFEDGIIKGYQNNSLLFAYNPVRKFAWIKYSGACNTVEQIAQLCK